jgi:hypothetical protein
MMMKSSATPANDGTKSNNLIIAVFRDTVQCITSVSIIKSASVKDTTRLFPGVSIIETKLY